MQQLLFVVHFHMESRVEKWLSMAGRLFSLLYQTETGNQWSRDESWPGRDLNWPFCSKMFGKLHIITTGNLETLVTPTKYPPDMHQ